jgi:hypothetical protein
MNITYAVLYACDCCGNTLTIQENDAGYCLCKKCRTIKKKEQDDSNEGVSGNLLQRNNIW